MKKLGITALLLAAAAGPALATHSIGIYEDQAGLDCEIADVGGGNKTFYIVHTTDAQPALGSAWKLEWDPGMTMTWVGDSSPFFKIGTAQDGAQISYGACGSGLGKFMIDAVTMSSSGTSTPCSYFRLGPEPTRGRIVIFCNLASVPFAAGEAIVNANGSCPCSVATRQSTWGSVKALYR